MKNILELLEASASGLPQKVAFADDDISVTYSSFTDKAKSIGSYIAKSEFTKQPVAVYLPRGVNCLLAMFGVVYSGNFYAVIDYEMPKDRIMSIFETLKPKAIITDCNGAKAFEECDIDIIIFTDAVNEPPCLQTLASIRKNAIDVDPVYTLFTSGSTGVPKGAVISHKNILCYSRWFTDTFGINENTVFGSQTPFYFSMSVSDIFATIRAGAEFNIISKKLFSFPMLLIKYLNERKVNTIYWVPSALCILANYKIFNYAKAEYLKTVLFAGEVMPVRQLNYWIESLPHTLFANLFGPTETTDICTYYVVNRHFESSETLPIGAACNNCDVFILNSNNEEAVPGEEGELYARGSFVAMGYYNNPEKTSAAFVQNPLNTAYPEIVYKTGDIVKYNDLGELIYLTRKDFQIKHMGYRIELGEVEAAANSFEKIAACAAIFDKEEDKIVLIFEGKKLDDSEIMEHLSKSLPSYMMPNKYVKIKCMPYNQNGKLDRKWLKENYKTI